MIRETIKVAIADDNREFVSIIQEYLAQQEDIDLAAKTRKEIEEMERRAKQRI